MNDLSNSSNLANDSALTDGSLPVESSQRVEDSHRVEDSRQVEDSHRVEDSDRVEDSHRVEDSRQVEDSPSGDAAKSSNGHFDFVRLERVVAQLVAAQSSLRGENEMLRKELAERNQTVQGLGQEIAQQKQRRVDAMKRLDDLVARVDQFEAFATQAGG